MKMKCALIVLLSLLCVGSVFAGEIVPLGRKWKEWSIPRVLLGQFIFSDGTSRTVGKGKVQNAYQDWDNASVLGILSHTYEDRGEVNLPYTEDGENTFCFINDDNTHWVGQTANRGMSGAPWMTGESDIRFNNDSCFDFGVCPYTPQTPEQYKYDLDTVFHHEVGHDHGWDHCHDTVRSPGQCSWNTSVVTGGPSAPYPPQCHHMTMGALDIARAAQMYDEYPYDPNEPGNDTFDGVLGGQPVDLGILNAGEYLNFVEFYYFQGIGDTDCYKFRSTVAGFPHYNYWIVVSGLGTWEFVAVQIWFENEDLGTRVASTDGGYCALDFPARAGNYTFRVWNFNGEGLGREYGIMISGYPLIVSVPEHTQRNLPASLQVLGGRVIVPSLSGETRLGIFNAGGGLVETVDIPAGRSTVYTPNRLASGVYFAKLFNQTAAAKLVVVR